MNLDTDMHGFWDGVHDYYKEKKDYLHAQLGNPKVKTNQTKSFYDPRLGYVWRERIVERLKRSFDDLNCINRNA